VEKKPALLSTIRFLSMTGRELVEAHMWNSVRTKMCRSSKVRKLIGVEVSY
jgi:hypothetical protein